MKWSKSQKPNPELPSASEAYNQCIDIIKDVIDCMLNATEFSIRPHWTITIDGRRYKGWRVGYVDIFDDVFDSVFMMQDGKLAMRNADLSWIILKLNHIDDQTAPRIKLANVDQLRRSMILYAAMEFGIKAKEDWGTECPKVNRKSFFARLFHTL